MASKSICFRWVADRAIPAPEDIYRDEESHHRACRDMVRDGLEAAISDRLRVPLSEVCKIAILTEANEMNWEDFREDGRVNVFGHTRDKGELDILTSISNLEWYGVWVRARHARNRCFSDITAITWI